MTVNKNIQEEIFEFIKEMRDVKLNDVTKEFNIKHRSTSTYHLKELMLRGKLLKVGEVYSLNNEESRLRLKIREENRLLTRKTELEKEIIRIDKELNLLNNK